MACKGLFVIAMVVVCSVLCTSHAYRTRSAELESFIDLMRNALKYQVKDLLL